MRKLTCSFRSHSSNWRPDRSKIRQICKQVFTSRPQFKKQVLMYSREGKTSSRSTFFSKFLFFSLHCPFKVMPFYGIHEICIFYYYYFLGIITLSCCTCGGNWILVRKHILCTVNIFLINSRNEQKLFFHGLLSNFYYLRNICLL